MYARVGDDCACAPISDRFRVHVDGSARKSVLAEIQRDTVIANKSMQAQGCDRSSHANKG
jgi:hypothetical protein